MPAGSLAACGQSCETIRFELKSFSQVVTFGCRPDRSQLMARAAKPYDLNQNPFHKMLLSAAGRIRTLSRSFDTANFQIKSFSKVATRVCVCVCVCVAGALWLVLCASCSVAGALWLVLCVRARVFVDVCLWLVLCSWCSAAGAL